jgi:hypothetical protein
MKKGEKKKQQKALARRSERKSVQRSARTSAQLRCSINSMISVSVMVVISLSISVPPRFTARSGGTGNDHTRQRVARRSSAGTDLRIVALDAHEQGLDVH